MSPSRTRGDGWPPWCAATSRTTVCRPTSTHSMHSEPDWSRPGIGRCDVAASGDPSTGTECSDSLPAGSLRSTLSIPGPTTTSRSEPKARAQCGNSARWDLCGGRPESSPTKGRPCRDRHVRHAESGLAVQRDNVLMRATAFAKRFLRGAFRLSGMNPL